MRSRLIARVHVGGSRRGRVRSCEPRRQGVSRMGSALLLLSRPQRQLVYTAWCGPPIGAWASHVTRHGVYLKLTATGGVGSTSGKMPRTWVSCTCLGGPADKVPASSKRSKGKKVEQGVAEGALTLAGALTSVLRSRTRPTRQVC